LFGRDFSSLGIWGSLYSQHHSEECSLTKRKQATLFKAMSTVQAAPKAQAMEKFAQNKVVGHFDSAPLLET